MRVLVLVFTLIAAFVVSSTQPVTARHQPVSSELALQAQAQPPPARTPDVIFVPTREAVRRAMLKMANVTKDDYVIDLGCGAGDIVVTAAKEFGARALGVDIDPQRVKEANENVTKNGVQDRVKIMLGDIFDPNLKIDDATVVTLYLLPSLNAKLAPRLKKELKPGTRIVSHAFDMMQAEPPWPAEKTQEVDGANIYLWTIPKR
ncbi:MAG TPA: 50S ribosomal protein L11 methyltransferase [Vicinamibacterales bacterium]|nr:50S ribosomal protein L11 methyltransferase [Vicinamibacterales bacterium]